MKSEPERDESETQLIELSQSKIEAGDADSGWVLAFVAMKMLPHIKHIADTLKAMDEALAPSQAGPTIVGKLGYLEFLQDIYALLKHNKS